MEAKHADNLPWTAEWYECIADASDVAHAKKHGGDRHVGDVLWRAPTRIGPFYIEHSHWGGYLFTCDKPSETEEHTALMLAAPDLLAALEGVVAVEGLVLPLGVAEDIMLALAKARNE